MIRDDDSRYLLYMEPKKEDRDVEPINDKLTRLMKLALNRAIPGVSNYSNRTTKDLEESKKEHPELDFEFSKDCSYKGFHISDDGELSSAHDYLLENNLITNSLCVYYVRYYRNSICKNDWIKLKRLANFYNINIGEKVN